MSDDFLAGYLSLAGYLLAALASSTPPRFRLHAACGVADVGLHAKAVDEDVDQAQDGRLPTGLVVHVAHADEGPQKVFRADIATDLPTRHAPAQQSPHGLRQPFE